MAFLTWELQKKKQNKRQQEINRETYLLQIERRPKDGGKREERNEKRIKTCYINIPTPHEECDHILQMY